MTPPVFFIHVMKTAGTSVGRGLRELYGSDQVYPTRATPTEKFGIKKLLELDPARRAAVRCYSVHMPAWVADTVGADFMRISVLREPVARAVSHLRHLSRALDLGVEEIYGDPDWHDRLTNYQTRIFSLRAPDREADEAAWAQAMRDAVEQGATESTGDRRLLRHKQYLCASHTAIARPAQVTEDDLTRAIRCVDSLDAVGLTESLPAFWHDLSSKLGTELPPLSERNRAPNTDEVSQSLVGQIVRDHQLDTELYQHVHRQLGN